MVTGMLSVNDGWLLVVVGYYFSEYTDLPSWRGVNQEPHDFLFIKRGWVISIVD
jgi:hypothetical protein